MSGRLAHHFAVVPDEQIAGALFDFLGYLTTREQAITLGAHHEAPIALEALQAWAALRGLSLEGADVSGWQDHLRRDG